MLRRDGSGPCGPRGPAARDRRYGRRRADLRGRCRHARPSCGDAPVAGATIIVRAEDGSEVVRVVSDDEGRFAVGLPFGTYRLEPQPVAGLPGTAPPIEITLQSMGDRTVVITYDTGLR